MQGLGFNLKKDNCLIVKGDDEVFEDSEFYGKDFFVKVKPLSKSDWRVIRRECTTKSGIDDLMFSTKVFMKCVVDWDINDDEGNPIECNEENKKIIDNKFMTFSSRISTSALRAYHEKEKEVELEKKD